MIRFATIEDLPDIRRLWVQLGQEHTRQYPRDFWARPNVDTFTRQVAVALTAPDSTGYVLLAYSEDTPDPVGFMLCEIHERHIGNPARYVFVYWLYVDPRHRGEGLGNDLIQMWSEFALSQGLSEAEITYDPGTHLWDFLGGEEFEIRAHLPLTQVIVRCEERRAKAKAAREKASQANGKDPDFPEVGEEISLTHEPAIEREE